MKNSNCHDKMAVVVEIPVSARIGMHESLQCLNNKPGFTPVEAESHCGSQSSTGQRKASFNTTSRNFNKPKPESVTNTKSSRSTTFISKTKYQYVKMTGEHFEKESMLVEELYPKFRSKSSEESMESEDSSSQGSGVYDKRLSLLSGLSHSDYETCGSQTSLDEYENDRLSVSSGLKEDSLIIVNKISPDGRTSRPLSSVLGDSELDDIDCDIDDAASKSEDINSGVSKTKPERPACLDQGMDATMTWLRKELTEMRALDQSLMRQFMDIQSKIMNLKLQQQQQKQIAMRKQKQPKQLLSDHSSELLGNHRFSWELDSLYEEDEYYDYDTGDDLDDELSSMGACGGYS